MLVWNGRKQTKPQGLSSFRLTGVEPSMCVRERERSLVLYIYGCRVPPQKDLICLSNEQMERGLVQNKQLTRGQLAHKKKQKLGHSSPQPEGGVTAESQTVTRPTGLMH